MFDVLVHADWSANLPKRWAVTAERIRDGWFISSPEPASTVAKLLDTAKDRPVFAGFDFPIGVPAAWGEETGVADYVSLLPMLGEGVWHSFFSVADTAGEIGLHRPFYPRVSSASTKQRHLLDALQVDGIDDLRRMCERATPDRRAACALFWTLGGNQVGKAALAGWKEVVIPGIKAGAKLWPFTCDLREVRPSGLTLAETYPAEAYRHVGVQFRGGMSKRRQADRQSFTAILLAWADQHHIALSEAMRAAIQDGFGSGADGEDKFDAMLGLCGMIDVVSGRRTPGTPDDPAIKRWEGWILGQQR